MLENIKITNNEVQAAQTFVAMNPSLSKNFEDAANALSERVAILYPNIKDKHKRRIGSTRGRGNSGRGHNRSSGRDRGCGHGRNNGGNRKFINGVDVSDLTRGDSDTEYRKLPANIRTEIYEKRKEKDSNNGENRDIIDMTRNLSSLSVAELNEVLTGKHGLYKSEGNTGSQ